MSNRAEDRFPRFFGVLAGPLVILLSVTLSVLRDHFLIDGSLIQLNFIFGAIALFSVYEVVCVLVMRKGLLLNNPRQLVNTHLALKVGRIFLALLYATIYVLVVKQEIKRFVLVFVLIYLVYLLFDTLLLTCWEKNLKKK